MLADVVRGHPPLPPRRDRHALLARAGRHPRPPHRVGDAGGGGVPRRRRSAAFTPSSSRAASAPGRRGGSSGTARRGTIKPSDDLSRRSSSSTSAATTRCSGASYGEIAADSRSMHKSQGFGVARSARADRRVLSSCSRTPTEGAPRRRRASILDGVDARRGGASRAARRSAACVARAVARLRSGAPRRRRSRRWSRSTRALDARARRRLAGAEAARGRAS